jgi:hypothetical protein
MTAVEEATEPQERAALAAECEGLILRVWERRSSWPQGWPPVEAAQALARLMPPHGVYRDHRAFEPATWLDALARLAELQTKEMRLVLRAGLLDSPASEIEEWLGGQEAHLDSDEMNVLEQLLELKAEAELAAKSPEARACLTADALEEVALERQQLFGQVVENLSAKPKRTVRKRPRPPDRS